MEKTVEGLHTSFLCQITGKSVWQNPDGTYVTPVAGDVWEAVGMQLAATYIGQILVNVVQWVVLRPILVLCIR